MLQPGLYEQVISSQLGRKLDEVPAAQKATAPIDDAEASKVLTQYLSEVVQKGLDNVLDHGGDLNGQVSLTNRIISIIEQETKEADFAASSVDERAEQLIALL